MAKAMNVNLMSGKREVRSDFWNFVYRFYFSVTDLGSINMNFLLELV